MILTKEIRKYSGLQPGESFAVVPDDFRMVAGNITRDEFDPSNPSHQAISFECVGNGFDCEQFSCFYACVATSHKLHILNVPKIEQVGSQLISPARP